MFFKKSISLLLTVIIFCFSFVYNVSAFDNDNDDYNFTNLIVFAKFNDEEEFIDRDYGETVRKITDNSYNTAEYNVSDYFYSVSSGKVKMKSLFLFDNGGSLTLSRKRAYYASQSDENPDGYANSREQAERLYQLKEDWSQAINNLVKKEITDYDGKEKYNLDELDKNNDGYIDLITIIYKPTEQTNISVEWASPLWNYRDQTNLVEIQTDKKTIQSRAYVQMTKDYKYLYTDTKGNKITAIGVNCHETAHAFGLYDLYQSSYQPVGYMSAMGKHTTEVAQFISVKEREALGWINNKNIYHILNEGDYTLKPVIDGLTDNVIGYKMDIPEINKTLYLEYRRFDGKGSKYDSQKKELFLANGSKIKGLSLKSGLVCYLLKTGIKFPNNMQSSVNNWNYSVAGGQYNNKPDAAISLGEEIEITDGLYINVTEMTENELTFHIEGNFFNSSSLPSVNGVEITTFPDKICVGESYNFNANVLGKNNPPQTIIWSVENNTDDKTTINENGKLFIGENEKSNEITVIASYENKFSDKKIISVERKSHDFEYHKAVKATCETDGNFEYYHCRECGKYFVDMGETFEETTIENMIIKKTGHIPGEWKVVKPATSEENGIMEQRCVGCNKLMDSKEYGFYPENPKENVKTFLSNFKNLIKKFFEIIKNILIGR